jgi:hypothetical protein
VAATPATPETSASTNSATAPQAGPRAAAPAAAAVTEAATITARAERHNLRCIFVPIPHCNNVVFFILLCYKKYPKKFS